MPIRAREKKGSTKENRERGKRGGEEVRGRRRGMEAERDFIT